MLENDKPLEVEMGKTPRGHDLVITTTQTGMFKVETKGPGPVPAEFDQLFTSLLLAKRAVENYRRANAGIYAKEALKNRIATGPSLKEQRKQAAMELKNGELETPSTDEEE